MKFTIPLPPVTKKNHSQIFRNKSTGRPYIVPSKQYKEYEEQAGYYIPYKWQMIDKPVNVQAVFYMQTKRKVDLTNLLSAICDVLVHYGVLVDDNSNIIVSHDGSRVLYDKDRPRTEIEIMEVILEKKQGE
jgi:Endodeoxyribonuclease RusA.